jgi:hypothetical protein
LLLLLLLLLLVVGDDTMVLAIILIYGRRQRHSRSALSRQQQVSFQTLTPLNQIQIKEFAFVPT